MKIRLREKFHTMGVRERDVEAVRGEPAYHNGFLRWYTVHHDGTFTYYTDHMWRAVLEEKWIPARVFNSNDNMTLLLGSTPMGNGQVIDLLPHLRVQLRPDLGPNIVEFQQKVSS